MVEPGFFRQCRVVKVYLINSMPVEIERKFIIKDDDWKRQRAVSVRLRQGYLKNSIKGVVRIRAAGEKGYITVKGKTVNAVRLEYEYEIPVSEAEEMLDKLCDKPLIEKTRHLIIHKGFEWSVDCFFGENQGLVVAEIELKSRKQLFEKPDWVGREVTHDPRYFNSNLCSNPYKCWGCKNNE